jgi:aspartyl-tRNA(Asn)/glutamyl-tRNA(Gln) amidotransferase subunit A
MDTIRDKLESTLARLEKRAHDERVFVRLYPQEARDAADAADKRRRSGFSLGPLDGVIVSLKDLLDVAGEPTTAGSVVLRDAAPATEDAIVVTRLREAGAVILGKTNMVEFAYSGLGINPHFGTPGNATNASLVPGGSSSGAGVSVAEGTSEIAIGSDTGGSVRIPAALNGVVGFKPTAKRVPLKGAFPLSYTLDSLGPLARSVAECAAADAILAGDATVPLRPQSLAGLRIGIPRGRLFGDIAPLVADAFDAASRVLSLAGSRVWDFSIETLLQDMREATAAASIASIEASAVHADWIDARGAEIDPLVRKSIVRSGRIPASIYIRMLRRRNELVAAMNRQFAEVDVLMLPTTPVTAPEIAPLLGSEELYHRTDWLLLRNPMVANLFDLTSISLPIPGTERPVGLMLMARHGEDRRLLEIAAAVEQALAEA